MSSPFEMIIAIVLIGTIGSLVRLHINTKARTGGNQDAINKSQERISQLEERVRVLERIVTDGKTDLRRELNALQGESE